MIATRNACPTGKGAIAIAFSYINAKYKGKSMTAEELNTAATEHYRQGRYAEAQAAAAQALACADNDKIQKGLAFNIMGIVANLSGNYQVAETHFRQSLAINKELGRKDAIASILMNIGNVYQYLSDYPKALGYYQQALSLDEETGRKIGIAKNLVHIGNVYLYLNDDHNALEYYRQSLNIAEQLGNKISIAIALSNIGLVYKILSDYDGALEYYFRALTLYEEIENKNNKANALLNIGLVYKDIADYDGALEYYFRALTLNEEIDNKEGIATNLTHIGSIYTIQDLDSYHPAKAEEMLLKALTLSEEIGTKYNVYHCHKILSDLYKQEREWEKYSYHIELYHSLEKEVISEESQKQAQKFGYERKIAEQEKQTAIERAETQARLDEQQKLLHNVLPPIIADRLLRNETFIAESYPSVSVLFMDLVGFTNIAAIIPPRHLIYVLNTIFSNADAVMEKYGLEKIKTIGDAYMAVAGAPIQQDDHAQRAAHASLELLESMNNLSITIPSELGSISWIASVGEINVRIGLHSGEAIGGVIGDKKFSFDLWGDAVNTASRMESHGEAGKIHCSEEFKNALAETHGRASLLNAIVETQHAVSVQFIPRGEMEIKGKGTMRTYFLERMSAQG